MRRRIPYFKGSLSLSNFSADIKHDREFAREHPDYFPRTGVSVFCGVQGSGKTLSAVQYVRRLISAYPKCKLVSNVDILAGLPEDYEVIPYDGINSLVDVENGEYGVLYLIDEMHLEFNSLESKNIPIEVFTEISQQRKQRKHIVGTSQLFLRLAKPFREQVSEIIVCNNFFKYLQHNVVLDGATVLEDNGGVTGNVLGSYWWFHTPELYASYDTYAKVERRYKHEWKKGMGSAPLPYASLLEHGSVSPGSGKGER